MSNYDEVEKDEKGLPNRLPFSPAHQDGVLGHLLVNDSFFLQCVDRIKMNWFNSVMCQKIWASKVAYYREHKRIPTTEDVVAYREIASESQEIRGKITVKIAEVKFAMGRYGIENIKSELTDWLHSRLYMEGVWDSKDYYNRGHFKEAYSKIEVALRQIRESSFDADVIYDFSNPAAIIEKRMVNVSKSLTFGHPLIDKRLLPEGNGNGCLLPSASTTLIAPVNIGKTATMMNVIVPNLKRQKHVLFIAHEGNIDELRLKFLQIILNRSNGWLVDHVRDPDLLIQAHIQQGIAFLNKYLTFMPIIRAGLAVEDVVGAIRRKTDELITKIGRPFDLVVDDYPAKLTTNEAKEGRMEKRHKDEIIYMQFNRLAEEYNWHSLTAIQTNREGSKINKSRQGYEERLLGMEDVLESWGPMADTSNVFTANRNADAKALKYMILANVKSRTSETDWAVVCETMFTNYISHSESLKACWYKGDSLSRPENYVEWLTKFNGLEIPFSEKF